MNLVLLGLPGSGKGTLAASLSSALDTPHISTGDIFRQAMVDGTELGNRIRKGMDEGRFVDDETTLAIVAERLSRPDCATGFILDGFPRTLAQAKAFTALLGSRQRTLDAVLLLDASDAAVTERLLSRRQCRKCGLIFGLDRRPWDEGVCDNCGGELYVRGDDNPESVTRRLRTYHKETAPVVDYYHRLGVLRMVASQGTAAETLAVAKTAIA